MSTTPSTSRGDRWVELFKLLPQRQRMPVFLITLFVVAGVVCFGLYHAPTTSIVTVSGAKLLSWVRGLLPK